LKRFLGPRPARGATEQCELCATEVSGNHSHVVNVESRSLMCVCRACYLLFTHEGAAGGKYKAVPERYLYLTGLVLSEAQWDRLQIPVGIAFFFFNTSLGRLLAFYPSPAGATESLLPLEIWGELVNGHSVLASLAADVEALLVYNVEKQADFECYVVPIDACYELVGRIRRRWKGFNGGEEAWSDIRDFFAKVRARSQAAGAEAKTGQ
jgi:hypothetical protein